MAKKKEYSPYIACLNCGAQIRFTIPNGVTIDKYRRGKICLCCGCRMDGEEIVDDLENGR